MGLTVLSAAPVTALVETATVRTRLSVASSEDALLAELIAEQSAMIVALLGRDLARQRYTETLPQTGKQRLCLSRYPIDPDSVTVTIDGTAIAATDYSVEDWRKGILFRESGWGSPSSYVGQDAEAVVSVTYKAGYLIPEAATRIGVVADWTTAIAYAAGAWVRPVDLAKASPLRFECTTAGTAGATEPTWPSTAGSTVADGAGALVWTARQALELPTIVRGCAWLAVQDAYTRLTREAGLSGRSADGFSESYFATHTETELPPNVLRSIEQLRVSL